jgi:hypothetical protein
MNIKHNDAYDDGIGIFTYGLTQAQQEAVDMALNNLPILKTNAKFRCNTALNDYLYVDTKEPDTAVFQCLLKGETNLELTKSVILQRQSIIELRDMLNVCLGEYE